MKEDTDEVVEGYRAVSHCELPHLSDAFDHRSGADQRRAAGLRYRCAWGLQPGTPGLVVGPVAGVLGAAASSTQIGVSGAVTSAR